MYVCASCMQACGNVSVAGVLQAALEASELEAALAESRRLTCSPQASRRSDPQPDDALAAAIAASLADTGSQASRQPASPYTPIIHGTSSASPGISDGERS